MFASVKGTGIINSKLGCVRLELQPIVNSDFNFDDACALRTKGAKDSSIAVNNSRDIIENVELIDEDTLEEEGQVVPELETAVNVRFIVSFGPLICIFVRTIVSRS